MTMILRWIMPRARRTMLLAGLVLASLSGLATAQPLTTPLQPDDIDHDATAVWGQGELRTDVEFHPTCFIWTQKTRPGHAGVRFGAQWPEPGPRHLRIGFTRDVPVGALLVRADPDVRLSLLRPDAPYPGEPDNEAHWMPAERVHGHDLQWWLLPEVTPTRGLRFSYDATADNPTRHAQVGGVYILGERVGNLAPMATPIVSTKQDLADRLIDGQHHSWWDMWSNVASEDVAEGVVSAAEPEWVMLYWPEPVTLDGLVTVWTGFSEADVQVYAGPGDLHPREAEASHWRSLGPQTFDHLYPIALGLNRVAFDEPVQTRAVRLLITKASPSEGVHPHVRDKPRDGRRVWLGELFALRALGDQPLSAPQADAAELTPPIPVTFKLDRPGVVTLVIDDAQGKRVRNLLAERHFDAGEHTVYWDGKDESIRRPGRVLGQSGRIMEGVHGIYEVDGRLVEPGTYTVHGLVRDEIKMRYQLTVNHAGEPPWTTADGKGGWLADHSAPSDVVFLPGTAERAPQMILSAYVAEAGDGVIWTDLDGRKQRSVRWLGGHWTGAYFLARDEGAAAVDDVQAYAGSTWRVNEETLELRISALRDRDTPAVINHVMAHEGHGHDLMRGLAARDGAVFVSLAGLERLAVIDARAGAVLGSVPLANPGGLTFDAQGRLLAISDGRLLRYELSSFAPGRDAALPAPDVIVAGELEVPADLAIDARGRIYVSDRGTAHNVKVFDDAGKLLRTIGTPGGPRVGPYDPTRMHNPAGLAVDERNRLWVVEADLAPKRISVWSSEGKLLHAFYGPSQYGGGGTVDPANPSRLYYARHDNNTAMAFDIDWATGDWKLAHLIHRPGADELQLPGFRGEIGRVSGPQWPIHHAGRHYMTNAFNSNPTGGTGVVSIWLMRDDVAAPVAVAGQASLWPMLREARFRDRWPEGVDLTDDKAHANRNVLFAWSDLNRDAQVQRDEVGFRRLDHPVAAMYVREDLALMTSYTDRIEPRGFTDAGVPIYDVADAQQVVADPTVQSTSGGGEAIDTGDWVVITGGPMRGYRHGELVWTYPNCWPSLHAGHHAPRTREPGQLIATTRLIGQPIQPPGTNVRLFAINGDRGQVFLLTMDGLFVGTLGRGAGAPQWRMPYRERGMRIDHVSLIGEHFWPTLVQPAKDPALLVAGKQHTSVVAVEGLDTLRRLPARPLRVTSAQLAEASTYQTRIARQRIAREGRGTLRIAQPTAPMTIDGKPDDWAGAEWVSINADTEAALAVAGERLYVAVRTRLGGDLLDNTGESRPMLFKTGGAIDLMIGTNPDADLNRSDPAPGDQRLVVTRVDGKPVAVHYEPNVPGTPEGEAHPFSSPWRTVTIDRVTDVSEQINLAHGRWNRDAGTYTLYEVAVPLSVLDFTPKPGQRLLGDIGVLRGRDGVTLQRLYWQNHATNVVEDVPSEAALTPALWGFFEVDTSP